MKKAQSLKSTGIGRKYGVPPRVRPRTYRKTAKKPMNTTESIYRSEKKPKPATLGLDHCEPKANYPGPNIEDPQPGPVAAVEGESKNEKILRILRNARKRLQSQGMPELDVELDELIAEVEGW